MEVLESPSGEALLGFLNLILRGLKSRDCISTCSDMYLLIFSVTLSSASDQKYFSVLDTIFLEFVEETPLADWSKIQNVTCQPMLLLSWTNPFLPSYISKAVCP
jgi:hypothetical protein